MIGAIARTDESATKGVTAAMSGMSLVPAEKAKENLLMPPLKAISEETKSIRTNCDASSL